MGCSPPGSIKTTISDTATRGSALVACAPPIAAARQLRSRMNYLFAGVQAYKPACGSPLQLWENREFVWQGTNPI